MLPSFFRLVLLRLIALALPLAVESLVQATQSLAEELATPLKVAQCRSHCVHMFVPKNLSKTSCHQKPDCSMCWEACQDLQSDSSVLESVCTQKTATCFSGCKAACQISMELKKRRLPFLVHDNIEQQLLRIEGSDASWPAPSPQHQDSPWVYMVLTRVSDPAERVAKQIIQTLELSFKLPHSNPATSNAIRVLVIGRNGLHTVYTPRDVTESRDITQLPSARETAQEVIRSLGGSVQLGLQLPSVQPETFFRPYTGEKWNLREISMVRHKSIVSAHITWNPRSPKELYLVTWEVDGGGLQGNLFTESSSVNLSLWSDTLFHIQVGVVGGQRSEKIIVNTSRGGSGGSSPPLIGISPQVMLYPAVTALLLSASVLSLVVFIWCAKTFNRQMIISNELYTRYSSKCISRFLAEANTGQYFDTDDLIKPSNDPHQSINHVT